MMSDERIIEQLDTIIRLLEQLVQLQLQSNPQYPVDRGLLP